MHDSRSKSNTAAYTPIMRTALLLACLLSLGCDADLPTAPSATPQPTAAPQVEAQMPARRLSDICEAIRSGRIKTFLPVGGC